MKIRFVVVAWLAVLLLMPMVQGIADPSVIQNEIALELGDVELAQSTEYSGTIPMNLGIIVGDSGNELTNALNYLAAVPFAVRSNSTHTASGLLLPDDIEDYASPLGEWIDLLGGEMNELVFLGDIQNPDHTALTSITESHTTISGTDHIEMAANLAQEYFVGSSSVVLVETSNMDQFSQNIVITDTSSSLNPMSSSTISGRTSSGSDWEYFRTVTPSGGGAIITLTSSTTNLWFDLLAQEDSQYYPLDYPYYDGQTVMFPYDARPGSAWVLHVIDLVDYDRTVTLNFDVEVPDAHFYPFTVESGEDCRIDFDLSVTGGTPRNIGLNVLDPSGNIILNANRFALFDGINEVSDISVSLSHPEPGQYQAYIYSAEDTAVTYSLDIVKRVISDSRIAGAAAAANGAGLASLLGAPLLYTTGDSLDTSTLQAIQTISPQIVYFMNPTGLVDSNIKIELENLGLNLHTIENFKQVQSILSTLDSRDSSKGSAILYDSLGTTFAAAGLSVAQRKGPAIPFSYNNSRLMTLSQIPEQISWNREYQMPLASSFSLLNLWTSSAEFSNMNPPFSTMTAIADNFFTWLLRNTGMNDVDKVITFAPYYGAGETLPPTFERAIADLAETGRYASIDTAATLVQVMRSLLRVPLAAASGRSHEALGSYLVYSYGDAVMDNSRSTYVIDNSNDFAPLVTQTGLAPVMQVGPSTISELASAPYAWVATIHGGVGEEIYKDDGRVALFGYDAWRAYDSGRSPSSPDADTDESPSHVVNPSHANMDTYNMSDLVNGVNLRGMFAFLDSCQLGSSYGPSTLMESGADAILAGRTDCLVGPADMFEYNVIQSMVSGQTTLGEALVYAFEINSHRYALHRSGLDSYVTPSVAEIIGASCLQFTVFGDPDITLYDWTETSFPVVDRGIGVGPNGPCYAYPGSTYLLPLGTHDPIGNVYASAGTFSISVFDPEDLLLTSGIGICSALELGVFEINFAENAPLGVYDIEITNTETDEIVIVQIIIEWPDLLVESIHSPSYTDLGIWNLEIVVINPQDVVAETTVQIRLNNEIILISDVSWVPGYSSNIFEIEVIFGPTGQQTLNVIITIGSQSFQCSNTDTLIVVNSHWVSSVLWLVIPSLGVAVILGGVFSRVKGSKVISLQRAMEGEISGDYETAFELYQKYRLSKAATRVAVKNGLPEEMMRDLLTRFGSPVANNLLTIANASVLKGEYNLASMIYLHLGQTEKGIQYKVIAELEEGHIEEAIPIFHDLVSASIPRYAVDAISHIKTLNESVRLKFVSQIKEDILILASKLQRDTPSQSILLSIVEGHIDDEYHLELLAILDRTDAAAELILLQKTMPKMINLTNTLDENHRNRVAVAVVRSLTQTRKPKQVAKYFTSVDIAESVKLDAAAPILEQLINEPTNKELLTALQIISKSSNTGSLTKIDEVIDDVKSFTATAEEMGISGEHLNITEMVPVIARMKNQELAKKFLDQSEKQAFMGSTAASTDLVALARYVNKLRFSVFSYDDVLPGIK
ncbi:MAG: hypothetical protein ACTSV2_10430, partial [Candidatus Thorarchaeota archaeon]